jgi:hypothetical protein
VVAFSGGRDSSYGLHLLKEKFGMQPITFSYDWGMVTDLARRNQARMCGKLGIEHIWISANIKEKRANIRANVLAWLKKPDLGIIPLFMGRRQAVLLVCQRTDQADRHSADGVLHQPPREDGFQAGFPGHAAPGRRFQPAVNLRHGPQGPDADAVRQALPVQPALHQPVHSGHRMGVLVLLRHQPGTISISSTMSIGTRTSSTTF